jgi:ATP-dependent Lon protease
MSEEQREEELRQEERAVDLASIPERLSLLPLRDGILYPFTVVPLAFDDERLVASVDEAMRGQRMVGVVALRHPDEPQDLVNLKREHLHDMGTVGVIHRLFKDATEGMRVILQGISRFRVIKIVSVDPFPEASILVVPEPSGTRSEKVEALLRRGYELVDQVIDASPYLPSELKSAVRQLNDANKFCYMIASMLRLDPEERQRVLEGDDIEDKLSLIGDALARERNVLEIGGKIKSQVDEEIQKKQRDYYLREQLKAIREELGETGDEGAEVERLRKCLVEAQVPDYVMEAAEEQLQRLANIPPASPEYSVVINYADWLCKIPWSKSTEDQLDLDRARAILDEDHYDLREVKDRIIEYLAVRKLNPTMKGPILCFVGPPGVGKTSLGRSIARALGREFVRMSLGGMRDEAEIRGHRRTYIGAMPGRIVQLLKAAGTNNPVFMLDEIDKVGADFRGDPSSALLEVLDPEQNNAFRDHYLDLSINLSNVMFIATANILDTIQPALLDRMEVLRLPGYTDREKLQIARRYLLPKQRAENGLNEEQIEITDAAIGRIIAEYTQEAGVRNLEREIAKLCRKIAARVASGRADKVIIDAEDVEEFLGARKAFHEIAQRVAQPGVATALAWTSAGGEILFIEATTMRGNKGFTLTGQLGEVMQESARAALGHVRSHSEGLGLQPDFFDHIDIHLHVPAGAVPKDGPSAGVAMATAIASALTGRKVRPDVAMTGEITLTGQVLPVGGIKEKLVAARRAGISTVILPSRNREHVREIEAELVEGVDFVFVDTIGEVLEAGLVPEEEPDAERKPVPREEAEAIR